jgi:hypothetical protein
MLNSKTNEIMTTIKIIFKPNSRIGNGIIANNSVIVADITTKENLWLEYGDQDLANIWANQILKYKINEPCTLIQAKVKVK